MSLQALHYLIIELNRPEQNWMMFTSDRNVVEFTVDGQNVHGSLGRSVESGAVGLRVGESETTDGDDSREQIWLFARHSVRHETSVFPADDVHFILGDVILSLDCVNDL